MLLVCGTLLGLAELARGEGTYQLTKDNKTLVWNNQPQAGDIATWSGNRDRDGYAHGFGRLVWYTRERGFIKPQLYARYWGRMVNGKFEGPINVHAKRKTDHAIFIDGVRVTSWSPGTAPLRANAQWRMLVAKRRENLEPEAPAAGPSDERLEGRDQSSEESGHSSDLRESIQELWSERWPKIDIDDSLRLLAFPPRSLRFR